MMKKKSFFMFIISLMILCFLFVGVSATGQCSGDEDCNYLDNSYCQDGYVMQVEGICNGEYECESGVPFEADDCNDGNYNTCEGSYWVHATESCSEVEVAHCVAASSTGNCNNGDYCDGEETCEGEGTCTDPEDIVCDNPPEPQQCYDEGYCDENDNLCVYPFLDDEGPVVSNPFVDPSLTNAFADIGAHAEDICSNIDHAYYYVDNICQTPEGSLNADDGNFDEFIEDLIKESADFRLFPDGRHDIYIQAWDSQNNPSNCAYVEISIDKVAPDNPRCDDCNGEFGMELNGQCNKQELLVCGDNPLLTAYIRDGESKLQAAEYFIDNFEQPNWEGIPMQATDGEFDEQCEEVQAVVNISELEDGTHYIKLHGKDRAENWGKLTGFDPISFIKDTTSPSTTKLLNPTGDISVPCQIDNPVNGNTITDGCYFVKSGTTIDLSATDPDPQQTGEFAGDVVINYRVYWSEYCDDDWTLDQEGQSGIDQPVTITLDEDSCHLIEYWAEDLCGNEEEHHFELDIVDTQAPVTTKDVLGENIIESDGNPIHYYLGQGAYIELTCEDGEPHPVGMEELYWTIEWSEDCDDPSWEMMTSDGYSDDGYAQIRFGEESCHRLTYWCVDGLGNTETEQIEIDAVDWTAPEIEKEMIGPWFGNCPPEPCEGKCEMECYVDTATSVEITATDPEPHPVNDVQCQYIMYWLVDQSTCESNGGVWEGEWCYLHANGFYDNIIIDFANEQESVHKIAVNCWDALNNEMWEEEIFVIDKSGPEILKTIGEPNVFWSEIINGADRLIETQNNDGGWEWSNPDTDPTTYGTEACKSNVIGVTALGLLDGFKESGNIDYLNAAKLSGDAKVVCGYDKTNDKYYSQDIEFLTELGEVTGDSIYSDKAIEIMEYFMTQDNRYCDTDGCTAAELAAFYQGYYSDPDNSGLVEWQLASWVRAAQETGKTTWANDMINEINDDVSTGYFDITETTQTYYTLGLAGVISETGDSSAITALINSQNSDGGFVSANSEGPVQDTAYAVMALMKVGEKEAAKKGAIWLMNDQETNGGWLGYGGVENTEVDSEAIQALFDLGIWITSQTSVYISAEDVLPHPSGLASLEYRVTLLEDDGACWDDDICQLTEGSGDWTEVEGSSTDFNIKGTSCHLIEIYAEDNVEKSSLHKQCVFVDNEAPDETNKVIGEPKYLCEDGEDKCGPETDWDAYYVNTSTPITLSCEDVNPHPVGNENVCFKISWEDNCPQTPPYMTEEYCSEFDGEYNPTNGECCVAVDTEKEFTFHFLEESLHNIEWYCEDALGNRGDDNIEYDNVDDTPPVIIIWNPTLWEASSVERCTQSVVVQAFDMKSGVNESSVYSELYYNNGTAVPDHKVTLKKTIYGTYEGLMDKQLPAGMYVLKVFATDNLGNQQEVSRVEHLTETIFVEYIDPALCDIDPTQGGSCDFTYHVCIRGDNSVQLWINKLAGIITPDMMNATIIDPDNEENDAFVGLRHGFFISEAGILQLDDNCTEINGKEQFTLHLDVPEDVASQLGMGKHDLQYWIRASLQPEICVS